MPFQLQLIISFSTGNGEACWTYIIEIVLHAINILTHFFIYADANRLPPWGNHYPLVKNYLNLSSGTTGARRKLATSLSLTRDLQPRFASVAKGTS